ncbi:hypothetical protein GCM10023340_02560 [Nocardioides marinquilinus]|uniref:Uncharacterized protein n=1 Tax=Nocardioides marinquilinus TaxID=1210400 RepID=A0ABP9P6M3_9ACTN
MDPDRTEAVQAVVDRLTSYQDSATEGTVDKELREALGQTDVDLSEDEIGKLVEAIEHTDQPVDVRAVLG